MFKTRLTELLGIEYPIIQGGMAHVSSAEFIAAVSNAGGLGTLISATCQSINEFRETIKKTKSLTDKPFAVNLSLFPSFQRAVSNDEIIDVLLEEGVTVVETSGIRAPDEHIKRLKEGNIKCIHKCTMVKHALSAQRAGADAITLVGFEQGGALGPEDITTLVLIPLAVDALDVPVIAAGGIGDARGFAAALSLGAEGVAMGTRFLMTKEAPAHTKVKEWQLGCGIKDTVVVQRSIGSPHRAIKNQNVAKVLEMEQRGATLEELSPLISGDKTVMLYRDGDIDNGVPFVGQVVELITELKSCREVIDEIISGAQQIVSKLAISTGKA